MQAHVGQHLLDVAGTLAAPLLLRRLVSSRAPLSGELSLAPWRSRSHATSSLDRGCHGSGNACHCSLRRGPCSRIHGHLVVRQQAVGTMQSSRAHIHGTMQSSRAHARGTSSTAAANACSSQRLQHRPCHHCRSFSTASPATCAHGFACAALCRQRAAVEAGQGGSSRALRP